MTIALKMTAHTRLEQQLTPTYTDWQTALADAVTDPAELAWLLRLPRPVAGGDLASAQFPLLVPRPYLARIRPGDLTDPLLLQVLPSGEELVARPGFCEDPLAETEALEPPGLLAKYASRVLIVTTGACAVHCRFCFRRHFPYHDAAAAVRLGGAALARIAADSSIREVILSGGDPLTLTDAELQRLVDRLADLPHLSRLRLHTRLPIVIPQRVTDGLLACLRGRLATWIVVHVNHAAEIDAAVAAALGRLVDAGIPVLSQSVLLRGVNDRVEVLAELFERLADLRVVPYYLHQLDRVAGAAHFYVPEEAGIAILAALRTRLPGYAVPRYVRETVGEPNKRVLA
jgi:EF-P beta-lysylation protein EpmB